MSKRYHIAFVLEQTLGHVTHTKNLETNVPTDPAIVPHWLKIPFERAGMARRLPGYGNWTVRAGWRARRAVAGLLRRQKIDALFFHTQVPAVFSTDLMRRVPAVVSLDATPINYDSLGQFYDHARQAAWLEAWKFRLNRRAFQSAAALVTWVDWAKRSLVDDYGLPAGKIGVIPPGVNPDYWARPEPRAAAADGPVKIIFVGGNLPRKGGDLLIEVFRRRFQDRAELHLVTRSAIEPAPGLFVYDDIVPNDPRLVRLYHQADVFCLPTWGDCLPMVLSEAMAAGLPVISTRVAGIPELVAHGESGFLIAPGDAAELAGALEILVENPALRVQMGQRGRRIVQEGFDAVTNTHRLLDVIKNVTRR
ncbi:MAG: glycosyltransferase family 4 protein [Chloroflexota bacterium]